jgi:HlyD family secretion protein
VRGARHERASHCIDCCRSAGAGRLLQRARSRLQGWVEADLIFVSPDEYGRVETLSVREGDVVEKGAPLFTVDPDLQANDVEMAKATLANAEIAHERAQALLKTATGTQKAFDEAEAALRTAKARLSSAQTKLGAPQGP